MSFAKDEFMNSFVAEIKQQQNEVIENMLGEAIQKGIVKVRQSNPILIQEAMTEQVKLRHSVVLEYTGSERIEELERENAYLKKLNGDLHIALSDFYVKTKENQWLKNQS